MKNYADENAVDLGPQSVQPRNAVAEIPETLVGRAIKIEDGAVVLDEVAEGVRLADIQAANDLADSVAYRFKRAAEYPSIGDQLDAIYKKFYMDDSSEYDTIAVQIEAVKAKYPKPE